jgi:hypothetical protein
MTMTQEETDRLTKLWDGQAQYVEDGGMTYRVYLPNGREHPVFAPMTEQQMYGGTSITMPDPPKRKPQIMSKKHTDLGN